ncbi:MAG: hypothetical protein IJA72_02050 [Clostridia bacterium]|nr:hypothetical protein [Clostridia bacterium]
MRNKRPVVYVARELSTYCDGKVELKGAGVYVSKAYLHFAGKIYNEDGTISKKFEVDYINRFESLDKKPDESFWEFYAETSDVKPFKEEVFQNYAQCKKYVNEQNDKRLNTEGFVSPSRLIRQKVYKQVISYGAALEEKYIPLEERQQLDENINKI